MKDSVILSKEIKEETILEIQKKVSINSDIVNRLVNNLVAEYCQELDEYMSFIKNIIMDDKQPPTDLELDDFTLRIPVLLYFTGEAQESLGVKEDVCRAIKSELYNEVFSDTKGTVADKTALAELRSQEEAITYIIYQRAYKKVKLRMEAASEVLNSVKKVITRRTEEYKITSVDSGRIKYEV